MALATAVEISGDGVCAATELIAETHTSAARTIENAIIVFPRINLAIFDIGFITAVAKSLFILLFL